MELGSKLKQLRLQLGLTLDDLSSRSNVSKSLLSQVERNISVPTVRTLERIARAMGTSIPVLFNEVDSPDNANSHPQAPTDPSQKKVAVIRRNYRKKLIMPGGKMHYELLAPDLRRKIEFIFVYFPAGAKQEDFFVHEGEECGVILEGQLKGYIGDQVILLEVGDSIYMDSTTPHRWENPGQTDTRAIWSITPPSF
ncbi:MAG: cupin domain-containing protein [Thermodesulfobacteriota bacterium]